VSVVNAAHEYVVNLIKKAGDTLVLKVVHVQPPQQLPAVTGTSYDITYNKKLSDRRDSADRRSLRRSRSFKVIDIGTNRKPVCDFLLVNNTN